ncbi:MAG: AMP-binding protein, partial [Gammaproteobacteria bacterium]
MATTDNKQRSTRQRDFADELISVARQLVADSNARHVRPADIKLDSDLTRDLGLDSLARVELFDRIEKQIGVSLDEKIFADAVKLKDLLPAINEAIPALAKPLRRPRQPLPEEHEVLTTPEPAQTLVEVFNWHAEQYPERIQIQFYADDFAGEAIANQQLLEQAKSVAAGLQALGIKPQQPVAIMLPTCKEYFYCFLGILLTGGIPVPLYPPARPSQIEDHIRRHTSILQNCAASVLITVPEAKIIARLLKSHVEDMKHVVTVDELQDDANTFERVVNQPDDIAFIQYTSGSTGTPKGVVLTHRNLLANIRAMGQTVGASSKDVFVSWLPLYHDMGLIGAWLGSQYFGARLVLMSPLSFLAKPQRWLWAIHHYGGTLSAAPNFGYELCLRRVADDDLKGLDLSRLRAAFNGAEAVSADTIDRFYNKFSRYQLRRETMMPVYGLAENSVGLTFPPLDRGYVIDRVQRQAFMETGKAAPAKPDDDSAIQFVACGRVLKDHDLRVVDEAN